jgi:hypothetical protein
VNRRSPLGAAGGAVVAACPGRTCFRAQAALTAWSRARQSASAADICRARRMYQVSWDD